MSALSRAVLSLLSREILLSLIRDYRWELVHCRGWDRGDQHQAHNYSRRSF